VATALIVLIILGAVVALLTAFTLVNNFWLKVNHYEIFNAPKSFNGFKILQLSDLHNRRYGKEQALFISKIKAEKPNIIVLTGDYQYTQDISKTLTLASALPDIAPTYYVTGNHEYRLKPHARILKEFDKLGLIYLDNKSVNFKKNGESITLAGLKDLSAYRHGDEKPDKYYGVKVDYLAQLNQLDLKTQGYKILLAHRPDFFEEYSKSKFNVVLTGHAHGGFIRLPFLKGLFAPQQGFFPKYTAGLYSANGTTMFVHRGCGGLPVRVFNRPEIAVLKLSSSNYN